MKACMFPLRDTIPSIRFPAVTIGLIVVNACVFLFELGNTRGLDAVFYQWGIVPCAFTGTCPGRLRLLLHPNYLTLLSSMFLHGGWMHIIGNMWSLWIFGDNVEDRMGPLRFVCFYLLCGLAAGLVHWFTNPDSTLPTVGASGAIAGVLGAYFFLFPYARVIVLIPVLFLPLFFELPALVYLGFWALSQVLSGTLALVGPGDVGGVAWWAHVGGFMAGIVLHFLFVQRGDAYRQPSRDVNVL